MPTEFYYPITGATHDLPAGYNDGQQVGGGNKNSVARPGGGRSGPMTHDDSSTYWWLDQGVWENQTVNIDWPSPFGIWTGTLTFGFRTLANAASRGCRFVLADSTVGGSLGSSSDGSGSFVTVGPTDRSNPATYRPNGGSWVSTDFADVGGTSLMVDTAAFSGAVFYITSIWGQVSYGPPPGGYTFILGLLPPLFSHFAFRVDFERFLMWRRSCHRRGTILTGAEVMQAWRELRERRHPTFFLPSEKVVFA